MTDSETSDVYEYLPVDEAAARSFVSRMAILSEHPEIVALREKQKAAGTYGMAEEALAEMRALSDRLSREMGGKGNQG